LPLNYDSEGSAVWRLEAAPYPGPNIQYKVLSHRDNALEFKALALYFGGMSVLMANNVRRKVYSHAQS